MSGVLSPRRAVEIASGVCAGAALVVLAALPRGRVDYAMPMGTVAMTVYVIVGMTVLSGALRGSPSRFLRAAAVATALILTAAAALGALQWRRTQIWPPRPEMSRFGQWNRLSDEERARWTARVAAHAFSADTAPVASDRLTVDGDWPIPPGARVALVVRDIGVEVWAMVDGAVDCIVFPSVAASSRCGVAPDTALFAEPIRVSREVGRALPRQVAGTWPQYRGDAERTGVVADTAGQREWTAKVAGPMRSTVSVAGGLVLAGTHDNGVLSAFRLGTGEAVWTVMVPNWIHQDAVSDGRVVLVGFGDNESSFDGGAPSGVAAYDLETGMHRWTAFDSSSVMTSPAIDGTGAIYATAAGTVVRRSLLDGRVEASAILPGGVIMGPPALVGSTVVFSVDDHVVCALGARDLARRWCTAIRGVREIGTAPTIAGETVLVTAGVLLRGTTWADLENLDWSRRWSMMRGAFDWTARFAGQKLYALDLETGQVRWTSRLFHTTRVVPGHNSGTPAISGATGVVVMPVADTIVAFDVRSGRTLWTAGAHGGRGPPAIIDGQVIASGHDGVIEVRSLDGGQLTCTVKRAVGYDRSGPAIAGSVAVFGDMKGGIEAVSTRRLLGCAQ